MATGSEVSLTSDQRSELSSIAQSRSLPAGYVFRAKLILMLAEGASFNTIKRQAANQCSHHHPLEAALPRVRARWARYLSSRPEGHGSDSGVAGPDSVGHPQETQRRFHPLELPQTGDRAGSQQRRGASGLERSGPETPSPGALLGQRRSRVRTQSGRHYRPVSAASAACRRVLRR